ncbi:PRKC apoptosis WT1 regulator protein isoform X1 [Hippoglossus stenolepis]|uniref:PRKC apoptosis WT1 regulator protein isoform X1 n=2 Tax=Hippoglossus stenolepis TaxID=195615 RepID=UPI001FAFFC0F|nr:PRKC apoptosis WT1 regulator protein isoform X1 [Hippoglossus stenolepis]XP_035003311.2 PRKC apoptosis WT1 regulator protein isoform X1 [Hippoglossus stenolepis]XP_035003312.2 PRKC apoptosis WT1 regulator protein isoform X1 [Hippoglossus stenolepis]XP_035003313.2 PRKC apoptosis WT1 regulator protein isoform X1 [Hippoglossus stenolepis]
MATGGFKPNATTDFLEEWKAKREKMRAKMLGDIAAATGAPLGSGPGNNGRLAAGAVPGTELTNNGNPERSASSGNCLPSSHSVARSSSGSALRRPEEDAVHLPAHPAAAPASNPKKAPPQPEKAPCASPDSSPAMACNDSDKESPSPGKGKEKKSSGPSARKGKGQIEKRKLREKRRSTGVVSMPSNESLDELDDDDPGEKDKREEELVQANTFQNEAMAADPTTGHLLDSPRCGSSRHKSAAGPGSEEEVGGNSRQRHNRQARDGGAAAQGGLEKRMEELERELARERQESARLLKAHQDKDDLIGKLREEIDLLNRDLDDIEDENEQLKQENKTLLKVVGQLTRGETAKS